MLGEIYKDTPVSAYQPSREICDFTADVQKEYAIGMDILERSWPELNNYSVIERDARDKRVFNAFVDEDTEDPAEAWKWRGTRSEARKKGIAMHANLTASYLRGKFQAQNDDDEIDREFSQYMDDVVEWMTLPTNSDYQPAFLTAVFGMITSPVIFMGAEYCEVMQTIKEPTVDGSYTTKELLDEVFSGFQAPIYSCDQILITNAYERNIQKQRTVLKRRYIDYSEARASWGDHENWDYVQRGIKAIYSAENGMFYDLYDETNSNLVEEVTVLNRRGDSEVCFVGGIYMGEEDVNANPIKHRDNRNAPKYNVTPFGYHRINEHFFYNKSLMNALGWDNALYDAMTELVMNRALLEVNMPVAISGVDKFDNEIIFPSSVTAFEDKDTKVTPLLPEANLYGAFQALQGTKSSMEEGSVSDINSGQLPDKEQKAVAIRQATESAKKMLSGVGKNLAESIAQYTLLMADIVLQHITVPQVEELSNGRTKLKYRQFLLENKTIGGKNVSKRLIFDEALLGRDMSDEDKKSANLKALEEVGYPNNKEHIYRINPFIFSKMKYLSRVDIEEMFPITDEFRRSIATQAYTLLRKDPLITGEDLVREVTTAFFKSKGDDMVAKPKPQQQPGMPALSAEGAPSPMGGAPPMESKMPAGMVPGM